MATATVRPKRGVIGWAWRIGLGLIVAFAVFIGVVTLVGMNMAPEHVVACRVTFKQSPDAVYATLIDGERWPEWWSILAKVEPLPVKDGKPAWHLLYKDGNQFDLTLTRREPGRALQTTIDDTNQLFSGTWDYDLAPRPDGGCTVTLTEHGTIHNPFVRCLARMMDKSMYVRGHLEGLVKRFHESATVEQVQ